MSKSIHVILLAGGYSTEIARGAAAAAAAAGSPVNTTRAMAAAAAAGSTPRKLGKALSAVTADGLAAGGAVTPALIPLDGTPAVVRLLRALQAVRRVTLEGVWLVHNTGDTERIRGPGGLFGEQQQTDLGLPAINFVPNGATGPHEWRGEVADLRLGLQAAAAASGASGRPPCHVAALSCSLAFMPGYNMQRLLEHSYLRGRDVLGCSLVNGVDLALEGSEGYTCVFPAEDSVLPRIGQLQHHSSVEPGMQVAEPFLFLRPDTAAAVAGGGGGAVSSLQELAGELVGRQGVYVAAIDLMFGRYHLRTAQAVDYADRFFSFCSAAALDPNLLGLKPSAVLQPYHTHAGTGTGLGTSLGQPTAGSTTGRSTAANFCFDELYGTGNGGGGGGGGGDSDYEAFVAMCDAFHRTFFGADAAGGSTTAKRTVPGMQSYLLPPTFYMTAYRRQGADIMF